MKAISLDIIKHAAIELILAHGYSNVTITDICNVVGITRPTFYKYAKSKEELLANFYDDVIEEGILHNPLQFVKADSRKQQLLSIFEALISETEKYGYDFFAHLYIANLNDNASSFDMRTDLTELGILIITQAQKCGEITNTASAQEIYNALCYCFTGNQLMWCITKGEYDWRGEFYKQADTILK